MRTPGKPYYSGIIESQHTRRLYYVDDAGNQTELQVSLHGKPGYSESFNWGYQGSGPAETAWAILHHHSCMERGEEYSPFADDTWLLRAAHRDVLSRLEFQERGEEFKASAEDWENPQPEMSLVRDFEATFISTAHADLPLVVTSEQVGTFIAQHLNLDSSASQGGQKI